MVNGGNSPLGFKFSFGVLGRDSLWSVLLSAGADTNHPITHVKYRGDYAHNAAELLVLAPDLN